MTAWVAFSCDQQKRVPMLRTQRLSWYAASNILGHPRVNLSVFSLSFSYGPSRPATSVTHVPATSDQQGLTPIFDLASST